MASQQVQRRLQVIYTPGVWQIFAAMAVFSGISAVLSDALGHFAVLASGAVVATAICFPIPSRRESCELTDEGLDTGRETFAWAKLSGVTYEGRCCDPELLPADDAGDVTIEWESRRVPVASPHIGASRLYRLLWEQILDNYSPQLQGVLDRIHQQQIAQFPDAKVCASGLRPYLGRKLLGRVVLACFTTAAAGFATLWVDLRQPGITVTWASIAAGFVCLVLYFMDQAKESAREKLVDGGILISPKGLAVKSSKIQGEMSWSELQSARLHPSSEAPRMIRLQLDGIAIVLGDEFELPLWYLCDQLTEAWTQARQAEQLRDDSEAPPAAAYEDANPYAPPRNV